MVQRDDKKTICRYLRRLVNYHFMRTYLGSGDQGIQLLGNHTMEVWRERQDS